MFYELFRSKMERTFPNTIGGAGIITSYKSRSADAAVNDYILKLEGGEHVSGKEDAYAPKSVEDKYFAMSHGARESTRLLGRAYGGFYTACHVFAYLSGKEKSFGENWDRQRRICANMICESILHISPIYMGNDVKDVHLEYSDFGIDGPSYRPIVLNDTLVEAYKRFPVDLSYLNPSEESNNEDDEKKQDENEEPKIIEKGVIEEPDIIDLEFEEVKDDSSQNNESDKEDKKDIREKPDTVDSKHEGVKNNPPQSNKSDDKEEKKSSSNPIFNFDNMDFIINNDGVVGSPAPANQEKKFNDLFEKYLDGVEYQVNKFPSGILECVIHKDDTYVSHFIDPGLSVGDGYYVMAIINTGNPASPFDTIPVHNSEEKMLKKIFGTTDRKYVLTPDEYQRALTHLFKNQRIYNVIDMSPLGGSIGENTKIGRIKKKPEDFRKLGQKLTFIINCVDNTPMLGRMRFSKFTSIDNFELRSDDKGGKVRSPFPPATLENKSGVVVQVDNDDVIIFFNGNSHKYHIDNYGIL